MQRHKESSCYHKLKCALPGQRNEVQKWPLFYNFLWTAVASGRRTFPSSPLPYRQGPLAANCDAVGVWCPAQVTSWNAVLSRLTLWETLLVRRGGPDRGDHLGTFGASGSFMSLYWLDFAIVRQAPSSLQVPTSPLSSQLSTIK